MKKRLIGAVLFLAVMLSLLMVGAPAASAADTAASIRIGGKSYSASVGDFIEYRVAFKYTGKKLATAQIELPMDFSGLSCYTQSELDTHLSRICPATASSSVVLRTDAATSALGFDGYAMNFVSNSGYSFTNETRVFSLIFSIEKAGKYDLTAKVRHVADIDDATVVDGNYQVKDNRFSYTESIVRTSLETPKVTASSDVGGIKVTWAPVAGAKRYRLYYKNGSSWTKLTETTATSYLDTGVAAGKSRTYTVRCLSEDASRFTSDFDHTGVMATYYPAPVLTLSNATDAVNIKWNAVSGASQYRVYYKGSGGWKKLTDTAGTSTTDKDVTSGTTYTYTIRAMDANGNHLSWYYPNGFSIKYISAPQFSVSNTANGIKISWNKVTGAEKYRVYYYGSKGWTKLTDTTGTSFIDTDVTSGNNYRYTVRCINSAGNAFTSSYRDGKSIKYIAAPVLSLSNTTDAVNIKWNAVTGAAKYRVYRKNNGSWTKLTDTAGTSATDTNLTSGTTYTYTIRAMDSSGNLISWYYADGFSVKFISAPTFSLSNAANGVKISWNKVSGAAKYRVFYYGDKGWTRLFDTADTSYIDTDVYSNTAYKYTVRCIDGDGIAYTSAFRAGKSIQYYAAPKLTLSNTSSGVSMKWSATAGATQYRIYLKTSSGWTKLTDTKSTSYVHTGAVSGTKYTYTIRAMDASGNHLSWYYTDGFSITYQK